MYLKLYNWSFVITLRDIEWSKLKPLPPQAVVGSSETGKFGQFFDTRVTYLS